eukprot:CAMPEP_0170495468 /NCGR_PEP_ID=MMETSP0208-20121228/16047_1 /TAXON_ID=197538 /ORGANISM="Strombidium inclinatum, Strain S3" /LENGTH=61 /DNA_ID=CAMNT_0010771701 /DNA_START=172 /DNA_END=357 /DNA_ORIENTATION=-
MKDAPWVGLPLQADKSKLSNLVPCTGYPTPGVVSGKSGAVIAADVFGKVNNDSLQAWLSQA